MNNFKLKLILNNLHNVVWYRLARYYNKYFTTYTVNPMVEELYSVQRNWSKSIRRELQDLAADMFENNGFEQFQLLANELRDPAICKNKLCIIIYLCIQISKSYINIGETFAVKYFIIEMQKNIFQAIKCNTNLDEGYQST